MSRGSGEQLEVEAYDDRVELRRDGRVVKHVTGAAAEAIRDALAAGDDAALDRLVARAAGRR